MSGSSKCLVAGVENILSREQEILDVCVELCYPDDIARLSHSDLHLFKFNSSNTIKSLRLLEMA